MSSIIKVDTIQTAAGGTPTVADLGVTVPSASVPTLSTSHMPAGSLIQTVKASSAGSTQGVTAITFSQGSFVDMDTFSITTSGSSQLICWMFHHQATRDTVNSNFRFQLYVDGVSTGLGDENNPTWYHEGYGSAVGSREAPKGYFGTPTLSAGAHEVKFTAGMYGSGSCTVKFQNTPIRYLIQEIKV